MNLWQSIPVPQALKSPVGATDFGPAATPASPFTISFSDGLSKTGIGSGLSHTCDVWAADGIRTGREGYDLEMGGAGRLRNLELKIQQGFVRLISATEAGG